MKNIAINTLKYTGVVTISQYIGGKKITLAKVHNEGGPALFEFLANCLVGDFTLAKATRPVKATILAKDANGNYVQHNYGVGFVGILTEPEKVYDNSTGTFNGVKYSFLIPKEIVENIGDINNAYLGLYTNGATMENLDYFAARCKLKLSKTNTISAALLVDWQLMITNGSKSE